MITLLLWKFIHGVNDQGYMEQPVSILHKFVKKSQKQPSDKPPARLADRP